MPITPNPGAFLHADLHFWHRPPREEVERDLPPLRLVTRRLPLEALDRREEC